MEKAAHSEKRKTGAKVVINVKWCKKCGICTAFCPQNVFVEDEFKVPLVRHPEKCIKCMLCVIRCPEFAVEVSDETQGEKK